MFQVADSSVLFEEQKEQLLDIANPFALEYSRDSDDKQDLCSESHVKAFHENIEIFPRGDAFRVPIMDLSSYSSDNKYK